MPDSDHQSCLRPPAWDSQGCLPADTLAFQSENHPAPHPGLTGCALSCCQQVEQKIQMSREDKMAAVGVGRLLEVLISFIRYLKLIQLFAYKVVRVAKLFANFKET